MTDPIQIMIFILQVLIPLIISLILFSSTLLTRWRWLIAILLFLLISSPLSYALIYTYLNFPLQANIGVGSITIFIWSCSFVLALIAILRIVFKIKSLKKETTRY
jgi:hypothetical protein